MALYIVFGLLLGFAIVGSIEARLRKLLRSHETRLARFQDDLARVEWKLDSLLQHSGRDGTQSADATPGGAGDDGTT